MPEIGMSGSMSGDGKRSVGHRPQATAPILDSTLTTHRGLSADGRFRGEADSDEFRRAPHLLRMLAGSRSTQHFILD